MSKYFAKTITILATLILLLSSCGKGVTDVPTESESVVNAQTEAAPTHPDSSKGEEVTGASVVFVEGDSTVSVRGEKCALEAPPFRENGVLYIPASACVHIRGASFVSSGDVYRINDRGNVTLAMEDYNVILFNNDSVIMSSTPILRDGVFCLPAEGLAKALSMTYSVTADGTFCLFGNMGRVTASDLEDAASYMGHELTRLQCDELQSMAEKYGADYSVIAEAAVYGELWSYSDGYAVKHTVTSDGSLRSETIPINTPLPEGVLLIEKNGKLFDARGDKAISDTPDDIYASELKAATARYMELLAAFYINGDSSAEALSEVYLRAVGGELKNADYTADLADPYDAGLYESSSGKEAFGRLFDAAEVGDILAFSASDAGAEYGFFNHCALIMEKDEDEGTLRLLQARGFEYGVGADLDMDCLSYDAFEDIEYYSGYSTVFLLKYHGLSDAERRAMVSTAYEKYNGYSFGYGGRMGLEETNCTELVDDAYLEAGVDLIDGDYESRLKEVLKGNTKNMVLIPDDLLFSGKVRVSAVFVR